MSNLYNYYTKNHGLFNSWDSATRQADVTRATNAGVDFGGAYTGGGDQNVKLYDYLTSDQSATSPEKDAYIGNKTNEEYLSEISSMNPELGDSLMDTLGYSGSPNGGTSGGTSGGTNGGTPTSPTRTAADEAYEAYIQSLIPSDETTAANKGRARS